LGAIRAIRVGFDDSERICVSPHCKFLHKLLGMLNGSWRGRFLRMRAAKNGARRARSIARRRARNPYVIDVSDNAEKIARDLARLRDAVCSARRTCSSARNIWCRRAREHASLCENAGFFVAL
jgi:hypothetical protein